MTNVIDPICSAVSASESCAPSSQAAYDALLPVALAIRPEKVQHINLDVAHVATACMTAADRLRPHAARLATLPDVDPSMIDELATAGRALMVAEAEHRRALQQRAHFDALYRRGIALRRRLRAWAGPLAEEGRISRRLLQNPQGRGYAQLAVDLLIWVHAFRRGAATLDGVALATEATLVDAARVADALIEANLHRAGQRHDIAAAADGRARFFTLAVDCYRRARRAALYLPWHLCGADALVPSLYRKHTRRSAVVNCADALRGADSQSPDRAPAVRGTDSPSCDRAPAVRGTDSPSSNQAGGVR